MGILNIFTLMNYSITYITAPITLIVTRNQLIPSLRETCKLMEKANATANTISFLQITMKIVINLYLNSYSFALSRVETWTIR